MFVSESYFLLLLKIESRKFVDELFCRPFLDIFFSINWTLTHFLCWAQMLQIHTSRNIRALRLHCGVTLLSYCLVSCPDTCFGPEWTHVKPQGKHYKINQSGLVREHLCFTRASGEEELCYLC